MVSKRLEGEYKRLGIGIDADSGKRNEFMDGYHIDLLDGDEFMKMVGACEIAMKFRIHNDAFYPGNRKVVDKR